MSDVRALVEAAVAACTRPAWVRAREGRRVTSAGEDDSFLALEVTAVRDGRAGRALVTAHAEEAVVAAVGDAEARAVAARGDGPGDVPDPAGLVPARPHDGFDPTVATAAPDDLAKRLDGTPGWIGARVERIVVAVPGSEPVEDRRTEVAVRVEDPRGGWAEGAAARLGELDLDLLRSVAAWRRATGDAEDVRAGEVRLVLGAEAVGALLAALGGHVFDGGRHAGGGGPLAGRLGTRVAAATINLSDSPRYGATLPFAFDAEGAPKRPLPLVQDGVAHRLVYDARAAAKAGASSTAHATTPGGVLTGPAPRNLVLVGGGAADEAELVERAGEGIHVAGLRTVQAPDPDSARVVAGTRGVRRIVGGRLGPPLRGALALDDDGLGLLARVEALTARSRLVTPDGAPRGEGGVVCPAVLLSDARVRPAT